MRRLLCILCLFCLLLGAALPAAAEELTEPCDKTANCSLGKDHTGLCDAPCDKASGCLLMGGHSGDHITELAIDAADATDAAKLSSLLTSVDTLTAYLAGKYPGFSYSSGALTVQLPAGSFEDVTCNVQLPGNAVLTLKGAASNGTKMTGMILNKSYTALNAIAFAGGETGVTLTATGGECAISNCTFNCSKQAFWLSGGASVPTLALTSNTFSTNPKALLTSGGATVGTWSFTQGAKPVKINLGAKKEENGALTQVITFLGDANAATENGWGFKFSTDCTFTDTYFVYDYSGTNTLFIDTKYPATLSLNSTLDSLQLTLSNPAAGKYTCINGKGPTLEKSSASTRKLVITEEQAQYIKGVVLKCPFKAATVNDNKVESALRSNGWLLFPTAAKGTYIIKEVKVPAQAATPRLYTVSTKDVYPIYHPNFMNTLRLTKDGNVKINCSEAGKRAISIPVESLEEAAARGMSVTLKTKNYSLCMDTAALKSIAQQAKGERVLLLYRSLNHKTLTDVGTASVNNHLTQNPNHIADLAFLVTAVSENDSIVDLQLGTISLTVPFITLPGTEDCTNETFALLTETSTEARKTEVKDGYLTTVLTDLTEHMVFLEQPVEETVPETTEATEVPETTVETTEATELPSIPVVMAEPQEPEGFPLWIPIVAVVLLAGGAAAWFLFFRKRLKK